MVYRGIGKAQESLSRQCLFQPVLLKEVRQQPVGIITPDGAWKAMEYSHSTNTWHEDSSGTFYMQGDQLAVTGEMEQFSINSLTKNEMTIEYMKQEDKGSVIVQKYYHDTFKRIN